MREKSIRLVKTGEECYLLGVMQEIEIWQNEQIVYTQRGIRPGNPQSSLGF